MIRKKTIKVLTILGSPHDGRSNTRALVEDFVDDVAAAGLPLEHQVISLGRRTVKPCKGCWNCTRDKRCPQAGDDLEAIKVAMLDCDLLILASPVYENQVTAQMKALFDRLFVWCHIFPLLGKYSLSACSTGSDGHEETGAYLEKILATYGTSSFGTICSVGGFTPGFFPWRKTARAKNAKLARRVARTVAAGKPLPVKAVQRRMFKVMKGKMTRVHALNTLRFGQVEGQPRPSWLMRRLMSRFIKRLGLSDAELDRWAGLLSFELRWWRERGWLEAGRFADLARLQGPERIDPRPLLLAGATRG
jgi:multimeric flavodoxin WrbA